MAHPRAPARMRHGALSARGPPHGETRYSARRVLLQPAHLAVEPSLSQYSYCSLL